MKTVRPHIDDLINTHKGKLKVAQGSGFRQLKRNDGGRVPHPSQNITGHEDCYVGGDSHVMIAMTPANYGKAVFELLQWAMANYPVGEETELPKQMGLAPLAKPPVFSEGEESGSDTKATEQESSN